MIKKQVLDKGHVKLLRLGGSEDFVCQVARYSTGSTRTGEKANRQLIRHLIRNNEMSAFEQLVFYFELHIPAIVFWHILRYRVARVMLSSGRRQNLTEIYYPEWEGTSDKKALQALFQRHTAQSMRNWRTAKALGVKKQEARYFLPFLNVYYTGTYQIDARGLINMFNQRLNSKTQPVTFEVVYAMLEIFREIAPITAEELFSDIKRHTN